MPKRVLVILSFSFLLSANVLADRERTPNLRLSTIHVTVTDKGSPVRGLNKDDFQLFVDGERAPIEFFEAVSPADPVSGDPFAPGKIVVMLFDVHSMGASQVPVAQRAAENYVHEHMKAQDLFAIAEYGRSLQYVQPFTQNPEKIVQAIRRPMTAFGGSSIRAGFEGAEGLQLGKNALLSFTELCRDLSSLSGRKFVVVFTQDFAAPSGEEYFRLVDVARRADTHFYTLITTRASAELLPGKRENGGPRSSTSRERLTVARLSRASLSFSRMNFANPSRFRTSNSIADAFAPVTSFQQGPPGGLPTGPTGSGVNDPSVRRQATIMDQASANVNVLQSLSEDTGGDVIRESNNLTDALIKLDVSFNNYYRLGFFGPSEGDRHKIEVKTAGGRGQLRYQKTYYPLVDLRQAPDAKALVAAIDSFKGDATSAETSTLQLHAVISQRTRDLADVVWYFRSGAATTSAPQAISTVVGHAYREDGSVAGRLIARAKSGDPSDRMAMTLRPGKYRVRLGVAGSDGRALGIGEASVVVPAGTDEGLSASSLVVASAVTPLPALLREVPARFLKDQYALVFKGYEMLPSVDNRVSREKPLALFFKLRNLKPGASLAKLASDTRLDNGNGDVFLLPPVTHVRTFEQQGSDLAAIGFTVSVNHLKPGRYHLTVHTRYPGVDQSAMCETDIVLD